MQDFKKVNATLKNEYLKAAFTSEMHQEEHVSSVVPYRLDCVFAVSFLKQGDRFVGYPLMSQYPQTSPAKCLKALEPTTFSDDVFDVPGAGFNLVNADMAGKIALVVKGTLFNFAYDVLGDSARIFDLCNRNTAQKTRDYIVISFNAYIGRVATYKRLCLIKDFRAYLAAKTHLVNMSKGFPSKACDR